MAKNKKKNQRLKNNQDGFSKNKDNKSQGLTSRGRAQAKDSSPQTQRGRPQTRTQKVQRTADGHKRTMAVTKKSGGEENGRQDVQLRSPDGNIRLVIEEYNMTKSHKALVKRGFHQSVASKTVAEVEASWLEMAKKYMEKPSKDLFLAGGSGLNGNGYSRLTRRTSAPLLFRQAIDTSRRVEGVKDDEQHNLLAVMLNTIDIGGEIVNNIFAQGWNTVQDVAATSSSSWMALVHNTKIWDFCAAKFRADGQSSVFMVVCPEYTIGEMHMTNDLDPYGIDKKNALSSWYKEAMQHEREIYLSIHLIHKRIATRRGRFNGKQTRRANKLLPVDFLAPEILNAIRRIAHVDRVWSSSQLVSSPPTGFFELPTIFSASRLKRMMAQISDHRAVYKALHFHKIPLLDRRMLAIILRACPQVQMIGIYDCPLVHFGDIICLLDLICEVNEHRRKCNLPEIEAFDFFPNYNEGMPYASPTAATYGLTWAPHPLDVVQRGFFLLILKAFMKAKAMSIKILFSKDKGFCKYLNKVPNYPLAVPTFLDALNRYVEIKPKSNGVANKRRQVIYDLLKPVRLGIETNIDDDWLKWYSHTMSQNLVFCSSCGYETLEEFFSAAARNMRPHTRVCAGCILQRWLDEEADHLKTYKRQILQTLCPKWKGNEFNKDAPVLQSAKAILRLKSQNPERTSVQATSINSAGEMHTRRYLLDLVRDNKIHCDSVQNLPPLSDLVSGKESVTAWGHVYNQCNNLDVYCRSVRRVREERDASFGKQNTWIGARADGGLPDHTEEVQPPRSDGGAAQCHDFNSAIMLYGGLIVKGWAGTA